jgi:hypothetical protein
MSLIEPIVAVAPRRERGTARTRALRFARTLSVILGAAGGWKFHRGADATGFVLLGVAGALLFYALIHPSGALVLRKGWMRFGELLGRINSVLLLSLVYFVVVTPIGFASRLFSRRTKAAPGGSYFHPRQEQRDAKHFEHPY